jgi:hypothetical protein
MDVVVWGKRGGEWLIADPIPGGEKLKLSQYGSYRTRGYVHDPTNLDAIDISTGNNEVGLTLTASDGSQPGFDPTNGSVQRIGNSAYAVDALLDDETGTAIKGPSSFLVVSSPVAGEYGLTVTGFKLGKYTINLNSYLQNGTIQPTVTLQGFAAPGAASRFQVQLTTIPGVVPDVTRLATPASALADLENSLSLGLITNHRLAESLSETLRRAEKEDKEGECHEARNILRHFIDEIEDHIGRGIDQLTAQVLTEDAEYLISSCKEKEHENHK